MRIRMAAAGAISVACACAVLLAGCETTPEPDTRPAAAKNGDTRPLAGQAAAPRLPVPRGDGSRVPADFNGDGHRDLVLNGLVKAPGDTHGDDAGIGIVYGTAAARGLDPAVRQLLTPRANAAEVKGTLPAAFDAEASCDLDKDGFADLIVATDPPYDGIGRTPVPLQLLFGSPTGLGGKAVVLRIPDEARYGNDWPDNPVCGDFDGDGSTDLAVTASAGRISFLPGPFTRTGAPRTAVAPFPGGGTALAAPAMEADINGDDADDLVVLSRPHAPGAASKGKLLLGGPDGPRRPGGTHVFDAVATPPPPALSAGEKQPTTDVLIQADFDGDKRPDLVTRTHRGERADVVALYPAKPAKAPPLITFSTSVFLSGL
ncbi:VCBS repeat-containing protein [Streptomyces sp. NBC_01142]|uniref:FG-GAP repeat domain-containing protein n=1 Tax=Streptomyces sp. NBC_01142 TaxID=2975865 RepID=UPI00225BDBAF|nr:VCBS repeat-containing protein [Streptomyces sp. NBC_01142]MCX4824634.1 VCBS repeat-containing protein [Streptomyces sp. NBC_01142]